MCDTKGLVGLVGGGRGGSMCRDGIMWECRDEGKGGEEVLISRRNRAERNRQIGSPEYCILYARISIVVDKIRPVRRADHHRVRQVQYPTLTTTTKPDASQDR